ncbi:MAG: cytochrome c [Chromatiales bacterium]|nr:cytochrome c [Chromatiales bacterium]
MGMSIMHGARLYGLFLGVMTVTAVCAASPAPERQQELRNLLTQDCGSCHGMRLTGGLGPPLTPRALNTKSRERLTADIRDGRPGTPMPPWKNLLSDDDIAWLVDVLLEGQRRE